jgi:hypothetical protein
LRRIGRPIGFLHRNDLDVSPDNSRRRAGETSRATNATRDHEIRQSRTRLIDIAVDRENAVATFND